MPAWKAVVMCLRWGAVLIGWGQNGGDGDVGIAYRGLTLILFHFHKV